MHITILETLIRMARYSSKKTDLVRSVKLALEEFLSLHYPKHILARALTKLVRKDPGQWACVKDTIATLRRETAVACQRNRSKAS